MTAIQDGPHGWRKSTKSNPSGNCVEVLTTPTLVGVRDSKKPRPVLIFEPKPWAAFIAGIKERQE